MLTAQWSPQLVNIIAVLKQLEPSELISRLRDPHYMSSLAISNDEKQAVVKAFSVNQSTVLYTWY